jgi:predicted metal-binding membrane protein
MAGNGHLFGRLIARDRMIVMAALAAATGACAFYILLGGGTGMSSIGMTANTGPAGALLGGISGLVEPVTWTFAYGFIIFFMWWLMMVAMMVPSAAPAILLYGALFHDAGARGMLSFAAGYLAVWAAFSLAATALQGALATGGLVSSMDMILTSKGLAASVLVVSGAYQFSSLKASCLRQCRGPAETLVKFHRNGRGAAFRMGMLHGVYCLGCCWALMALLFVGGIMNLWWIGAIAAYVAAEKLTPFGGRLASAMGAILTTGGLALAATSLLAG